MPNISWSKCKQAMKFGKLIEYSVRNIFAKKHAENEVERLIDQVKASGLQLSILSIFSIHSIYSKYSTYSIILHIICIAYIVYFNIYWYPSTWTYNKNKLHKSLDCWSRYKFNFDFLEEGLGIVPAPNFVYDLSRKIHVIFY